MYLKNKQNLLLLVGFFLIVSFSFKSAYAQEGVYDRYFTSDYLKVDLSHSGTKDKEYYFVEQFHRYTPWAGSKKKLIDKTGFGDNYFEVLDSATHTLIYSKGYNNLFNEWQETEEGKTGSRSFEEVIQFPFPKQTVEVKLYRKKSGDKTLINTFFINPKSHRITKGTEYSFKTERLYGNKPYNQAVDIALIAEGYTKDEMEKFRKDSKRMADFLFSTPPFTDLKDRFNIWLIYSVSEESGTDIFGDDVWKRTVVNSHFYTFGSERYLTSQSLKKIYDIAALVPNDQVYVLVNSPKYGGGAIYNYYNLTSVDHPLSPWVFVHEFGHGFVGLADEYYDGSTAYNNMYNTGKEPWQVNISNLSKPETKWQKLVRKGTPIPTPQTDKYKNEVGFFEGGGYVAKGIYRPQQTCEMKELKVGFCKICTQAIKDMVKLTTDE